MFSWSRARVANIVRHSTLGNKLTEQGFFEIDQLTRDRISHSDLAQCLGIGVGIAALIVRYVEEDVARVRAGTFDMDSV